MLWLVAGLTPSAASHLVGGELTYRYIDSNGPSGTPVRYAITARIYFNREPGSSAPTGSPSIRLNIFSKAPGGTSLLQTTIERTSAREITPPVLPGCSLRFPRVTLGLYTTTVDLPALSEGYLASFSANARNVGIANLNNSLDEGMTLSVDMAPAALPNSSPVFSENGLAAICLGDTSFVLNNAYDADGDRLSYSLATPASRNLTQPVSYAAGYSAAQPFGATGYAAVDARTGLARYLGLAQGTYLLAIDVKEYRTVNGQEVLLGTLRRDMQIVVRACGSAPNQSPSFAPTTSVARDFVIEEGQTVDFNVTGTDPEGQPLVVTMSSVLLDGPGPINASVNGQQGTGIGANPVGSVDITGTGTVTGSFRLLAGCSLARPAPYDVLVKVADAVCGSKTIVTVFRITVTRRAPTTSVRGDSVLCAQSLGTYTVRGPSFAAYEWAVQGGEVQGPTKGSTVQVLWTTSGTGSISARGVTPTGCLTDPATRPITVRPGPALTGPAVYCLAAHTGLRYTVEGAPAAYQWSVSDGTIVSGQGTNSVLVDIVRGATATIRVENSGPVTCGVATLRTGPDDTCLAFFNIITPNGDSQNDVFAIQNIERYPNAALTIYNRWGRQVYYSPDYRNTYTGEGTSPGTYYYLCQLSDGTRYKGWFELVR